MPVASSQCRSWQSAGALSIPWCRDVSEHFPHRTLEAVWLYQRSEFPIIQDSGSCTVGTCMHVLIGWRPSMFACMQAYAAAPTTPVVEPVVPARQSPHASRWHPATAQRARSPFPPATASAGWAQHTAPILLAWYLLGTSHDQVQNITIIFEKDDCMCCHGGKSLFAELLPQCNI